jgi:hypothetical protein
MSLGLGAKAKPTIAPVGENEVVIAKDSAFLTFSVLDGLLTGDKDEGVFIGKDGKPSRDKGVEWVASPDEIAFIKPYIFSVFPAGTVPSQILDGLTESVSTAGAAAVGGLVGTATGQQQAPSMIPTSVVQIHSSISPHISQIFPIPFSIPSLPTTESTATASTIATTTAVPPQNAIIHIPLSASSTQSPLYVITTPTDKAAAQAEGSSIWQFVMRPWADQIDELVLGRLYSDALELLDVVNDSALSDKVCHETSTWFTQFVFLDAYMRI